MEKGFSEDDAQERAAKIYNSTRKLGEPPLTHGDSKPKKKKKKD